MARHQPKLSSKSGLSTLPRFTPVSLRARHDGWTHERQRRFIAALASTGCVTQAARAAQMSLEAAYTLRRHAKAAEFRRAWEEALDLGCELLEDHAMARAIEGVEQPVYHFGVVVGTRRVHNDKLAMFLLRNRRAARFAADSVRNADEAAQAQLDRLKQEWRKQWEAERTQISRDNSEHVVETLNAKLELMRQRQLEWQSPQTRAALEAYEAAKANDAATGYRPDYGRGDGDGDGDGDEVQKEEQKGR
jgi:hypothetical protein